MKQTGTAVGHHCAVGQGPVSLWAPDNRHTVAQLNMQAALLHPEVVHLLQQAERSVPADEGLNSLASLPVL